mmetsp:Transcript_49263/g.145456  ORF Transcript_49263/g.145456 Transcript_49263/m.145456 type:complete len:588 (-) Transcript_49263:34-1797(-)
MLVDDPAAGGGGVAPDPAGRRCQYCTRFAEATWTLVGTCSQGRLLEALLDGLLHRVVQGLGLDRGDAQLQAHVLELLEADAAIMVDVEPLEEDLHGVLVDSLVRLADLAGRGERVGEGARHVHRGHVTQGLARLHAMLQVRGHVVHELLRGEAGGAGEVASALAVAERLVHRLAAVHHVLVDDCLVRRIEEGSVLHGAQQGDHHAQRVHGGLLAAQVRVPEVGDGAVGGLELLDERAVRALADEVGGDEAGAAVHLRDLVREHVAVVIVARHAEAASGPADDLHRGGVTDQVLQLAAGLVEQAGLQVILLVVGVEDLLHLLPEALLPLEDRLLRHHVGDDVGREAALEEDVGQVVDVVERVVVDDDRILLVVDLAAVDDDGLSLHVIGEERGEDAALADTLPPSAVLAADGMALEEDRTLEAQLDAGDVDRVAGDGDAVPASSHRAVRRAPGLPQAQLLHLIRGRRDRGLLEDGTDLRAGGHGVVQHLVLGVVASLAAEVKVLPVPGVNEGLHPLFADDLHRVPRHLFAGDVRHRRRNEALRGEPPGGTATRIAGDAGAHGIDHGRFCSPRRRRAGVVVWGQGEDPV